MIIKFQPPNRAAVLVDDVPTGTVLVERVKVHTQPSTRMVFIRTDTGRFVNLRTGATYLPTQLNLARYNISTATLTVEE